MLTAHDLGCGEIHGIEAGRTEAADLNAGDRFAQPRFDRREARDVGAGLADRIDHAEDDVIDNVFRQIVALFQSFPAALWPAPARSLHAARHRACRGRAVCERDRRYRPQA